MKNYIGITLLLSGLLFVTCGVPEQQDEITRKCMEIAIKDSNGKTIEHWKTHNHIEIYRWRQFVYLYDDSQGMIIRKLEVPQDVYELADTIFHVDNIKILERNTDGQDFTQVN